MSVVDERRDFDDISSDDVTASENEREFLIQWKARIDQLRERLSAQDGGRRNTASDKGGKVSENSSKSHSLTRQVILGNKIEFDHVDIVSPEGKLLVKDLCFEGENWPDISSLSTHLQYPPAVTSW